MTWIFTLFFTLPAGALTPLDSLYSNSDIELRVPMQAPPAALADSFKVVEPDREPASAKKKSATAKKSGRRSTIPAAVEDGFELRVRYNGLTSLFWVVRRASSYELVYANSSKSRATLTLSADVFRQLHNAAEDLHPADNNIARCKDSSMQIYVLSPGRAERSHTDCVNAKSADAEKLRVISQMLALMVR